jgi:tRNA threonylcarbamoyladenosine biosynthesis protein TsaE
MVFQIAKEEIGSFAPLFWQQVNGARVIAFHGEMGAGKTTIIELCKFKGIRETVSSPTFSIINEYSFSEEGQERKIYHMDWYRLNSLEEMIQAGVEDCLYSGELCLVEWPEKAPQLLDENTLHVYVEAIDDTHRQLKLERTAPHSISPK